MRIKIIADLKKMTDDHNTMIDKQEKINNDLNINISDQLVHRIKADSETAFNQF